MLMASPSSSMNFPNFTFCIRDKIDFQALPIISALSLVVSEVVAIRPIILSKETFANSACEATYCKEVETSSALVAAINVLFSVMAGHGLISSI